MDTLTNQKIQDRLAGYDEDVQAFLQLAQIRRRNPFSESHEAEASQSYREIAWKGYRHRSFLEFDPHGMDPALRASWSYQPWILSGHPCREPSQQSWDIVDCARGLNILPGSKSREPDELLKSQAELARLYLEAHGSELQGLLSRGIRSQRLEWSLSAKPCLRADTRLLLSLKAMGWIAAGMALALPVDESISRLVEVLAFTRDLRQHPLYDCVAQGQELASFVLDRLAERIGGAQGAPSLESVQRALVELEAMPPLLALCDDHLWLSIESSFAQHLRICAPRSFNPGHAKLPALATPQAALEHWLCLKDYQARLGAPAARSLHELEELETEIAAEFPKDELAKRPKDLIRGSLKRELAKRSLATREAQLQAAIAASLFRERTGRWPSGLPEIYENSEYPAPKDALDLKTELKMSHSGNQIEISGILTKATFHFRDFRRESLNLQSGPPSDAASTASSSRI